MSTVYPKHHRTFSAVCLVPLFASWNIRLRIITECASEDQPDHTIFVAKLSRFRN